MGLSEEESKTASGIFLFSSLTACEREAFLKGREAVEFFKGEVIYSPDKFRRSLGVILSGEAQVQNDSGTVLNVLREGDCFGAAALFSEIESYVTTILAKSKMKVLFLSNDELEEAFLLYPRMAISYIRFISGRIQFLNRKIESFTAPNAEEALLGWVYENAGDGGRAVLPGGFSALARELNLGRASLYRALDRLSSEGRLRRDGRNIYLVSGKEDSE